MTTQDNTTCRSSLSQPETPESYFTIPPQAPKELNIDALLATLSRARAIVDLLEGDGEKDSFLCNHGAIMNTLWCLNGMLDQAQQIARHPYSSTGESSSEHGTRERPDLTEQSKTQADELHKESTSAATSDEINDSFIEALNLSVSSVSDLGTLFKAIREASEEHTPAFELAGIGQYLSDDWANLIDVQRENFCGVV